MESKILKQEENPFLHRKELLLEIKSNSNPSFDQVKKEIEKPENLVVIKKIDSGFGKNIFHAKVFIYESEKLKDEIEVIPKKTRKKLEEEKKKAEESKKQAEEEAKKAEEAEKPTETQEAEAKQEEQAEESKSEENSEHKTEENQENKTEEVKNGN